MKDMMLILLAASVVLLLIRNIYLHQKAVRFTDTICGALDRMISREAVREPYEDTLEAKVQGKLNQYASQVKAEREEIMETKREIQEMVSDISHQVKTPIANIKMFHGILQQHELNEEKRESFLKLMEGQIDKLDFLMQSMIQMSRLEAGILSAALEDASVYQTIARALNGAWEKAERKHIGIQVNCDPHIHVRHDPKWTAEALFNLLDNAVKYTREGGLIKIEVKPGEFYTRIDVADNGKGIAKDRYHKIFQRFYREPEITSQEGVGLGLYLAREILSMQKGYISVRSVPEKGTIFSVFLLNTVQDGTENV